MPRHKVLWSSTSAIRSVHFCGGVPFLHVIPTLFSFLETAESRRRFRVRDLVRRYGPVTPKEELVRAGGAIGRSVTSLAADTVRGSIACLAFLQDSEAPVVFSGTVVHSDGIVATSSNCLRHLKGTKYKIGVKILGSPMRMAYEGVLLHTDFVSKIAFVKILRCEEQLPVPKCRELDCLKKVTAQVVVAGCTRVYGHWLDAICRYSVGLCRSIDDVTESTESHNARTSGQLIKASCCIEESAIGGALVSRSGGLLGVIHNVRDVDIQATPIEDVLKYLEYLEKDGEHAKDMEGV
ncbi:hypothetical protein RHGRI_026770 [Rhododendron griersonianum]|uniref:Uncharacterized protein n=1 Tax=Rhododendron griersonianum TaxID=479676 RepID=A0AAV6IVE9_9ERIC|nr:hypothetical protein RHGRI_026770 [Rhododendron griersonianum]